MAFDKLKRAISSEPVLKFSEFDKQFKVLLSLSTSAKEGMKPKFTDNTHSCHAFLLVLFNIGQGEMEVRPINIMNTRWGVFEDREVPASR